MATMKEMKQAIQNEFGFYLDHITVNNLRAWFHINQDKMFSADRDVLSCFLHDSPSYTNDWEINSCKPLLVSSITFALYNSIGYIDRCKNLEWSENLELMYRSIMETLGGEEAQASFDNVAMQMVQDAYGEMPTSPSEPSSSPCKPFERVGKSLYYYNIAKAVAARSTCMRRRYGAVIVKNDEIIATGYNGSARGEENCCDKGICWREEHNIPHGEQYEKCVAVHAEQNAIISASRREMIGADMYLYGCEWNKKESKWVEIEAEPCLICGRMIKNAGISCVISMKDCKKYAFFRNYVKPKEACQDDFDWEK